MKNVSEELLALMEITSSCDKDDINFLLNILSLLKREVNEK